MPEETIVELLALARAAQAWARWREQAEQSGDFSRCAEVDELERRAAQVAMRIAQLRTEPGNDVSSLAAALSRHDIITICAACKQVRTDDSEWIAVEEYLRDRHGLWASHSLCGSCARRIRTI